MKSLIERLDALKDNNDIAGYEAPHESAGIGRRMLPWVIMPYNGGPASTYYDENALLMDIRALEAFGPINFVLGSGTRCRHTHDACW